MFEGTKTITEYATCNLPEIDLSKPGTHEFGSFTVTVVDPGTLHGESSSTRCCAQTRPHGRAGARARACRRCSGFGCPSASSQPQPCGSPIVCVRARARVVTAQSTSTWP